MAAFYGAGMVNRLGLIAGWGALGLALWRLSFLIRSEGSEFRWQLLMVGAAVLAAVVTWAARSYRLSPTWIAILNLAGAAVAFLRVAAPATLVAGVVPTTETWVVLGEHLRQASELIRYGNAPVAANPGLLAVVVVVFWGQSFVTTLAGLLGRPLMAVAPPALFYLQTAAIDRSPPALWATAVIAALVGLALLGTNSGKRRSLGQMRRPDGALAPRWSASLPIMTIGAGVLAALLVTTSLAAAVPESGYFRWRASTGLGANFLGGVSYDFTVGLQQRLVDQSDRILFVAKVSEGAPSDLSWRLTTLDTFNGTYWSPHLESTLLVGTDHDWERDDLDYDGDTIEVAQSVRIVDLREYFVPAMASPINLRFASSNYDDSLRVRDLDGSALLDVPTSDGLTYLVSSEIPVVDIAALATSDGSLTGIFQEAVNRGALNIKPKSKTEIPRADVLDEYTDLPRLDRAVAAEAVRVTAGAESAAERALLLEQYLRTFQYDATVSTGHTALELADWLTDPTSRNYRTGYCEQFATAMAVMARTLNIPSRVIVGFTPGKIETDAQGEKVHVVRGRNAHAWVELWMPTVGWVSFDPTPRPENDNPARTQQIGFDPSLFIPDPDPLRPGQQVPTARIPEILDRGDPPLTNPQQPLDLAGRWIAGAFGWVAGIILVVSSLPGLKVLRRRRRLRRIKQGDVTVAWADIVDRLRDLDGEQPQHLTANELATAHHPELQGLANAYSAAVYGDHTFEGGEVRNLHLMAEKIVQLGRSRGDRVRAAFRLRSLRKPNAQDSVDARR